MNLAVIGMQFGDEGKGKIVDFLAKDFDIVARFSGGSNAGHTVVFKDKKIKFHLVPSGVLQGKIGVLGSGMVIDLDKLKREIENLKELGVNPRILISSRAHIVTKIHRMQDSLDDEIIKIGTTRQGIGPAYISKVRRVGIRIADTFDSEILLKKLHLIARFSGGKFSEKEIEEEAERIRNAVMELKDSIEDTEIWINKAIDSGKSVLFEGSQGTFLDLNFGTYPYVTSSPTTVGGVSSGLGVPPSKIHRVMGVMKAYTTRVGNGPFPTEITGENAEALRKRGNEFGATTGRPRRVGYLDLVLLRYASMINGLTGVAITKVDVLFGLDSIPVATEYQCNGKIYDYPPASIEDCKTKYEYLNGFSSINDANFKKFIDFIEKKLARKVKIVSYGPLRNETLIF